MLSRRVVAGPTGAVVAVGAVAASAIEGRRVERSLKDVELRKAPSPSSSDPVDPPTRYPGWFSSSCLSELGARRSGISENDKLKQG
jgi:hypothetical protein